MQRLRKGDMVMVISGTEKGRRGKVLQIDREANRVVVQGINLVYKHHRRSQKYPQGGRIQREAAIHASNVMLFDEASDRPVRVRVKRENGRAMRVSSASGKSI